MNISDWNKRRRRIHRRFYGDLVPTAECGAFDGGCVVVAQALHAVIGGEIVVLVRENGNADHAAVFLDGMLWDYDGPLPPSKFIKRFIETELGVGLPFTCVGFRTIREGDLKNAYRDDALAGRLSDLFLEMLPEFQPAGNDLKVVPAETTPALRL